MLKYRKYSSNAQFLRAILIISTLNVFTAQNIETTKQYCAHPKYPCLYYECIPKSNEFAQTFLTKMQKCPKGLAFDEDSQKCGWVLPWQRCKDSEVDAFEKAQGDSDLTIPIDKSNNKINNENLNQMKLNKNRDIEVVKDAKNLQDAQSYLYKVLSSLSNNQVQLKSLPNSQNAFQSETNKINLTYLTINEADLNDKTDKLEITENNYQNASRLEYDEIPTEDDSQYAFIVVPLKVSGKDKKFKAPKKQIEHKVATPQLVDGDYDENLKKFQNLYKYKKVCYFTNWAQYRQKPGFFTPEHIDPFLCTHIIYAFAYIDNVTHTIKTIEPNDEDMYKRINDLKYKNPKLKTMLGIGGWNMESQEFSKMVSEKRSRMIFIYHAIKFVRHHRFDGFDLDWEFPADRGGIPEDKQKFTIFVQEFRQAINEEELFKGQERLILSAAVAAGKQRIDKGYEIAPFAAALDFINLMTFDFHGSWDKKTGLNAPLYSHENVTEQDAEFNQDWSVNYWISNGCPAYKIVLGLPAYGRTFTLKDADDNGLGAPALGDGTGGNFTQTPGFLSYYECCALRKTKDWTTVWLSQSKSHYMFNQNQWVSFDDIKSFHLRTAYVVAKKLGGLFLWSLDMDDFSGKFCDLGSYPLIKNSMSLLMDYMPEYYSSNVKPEPKTEVKSVASNRPANMVYFLKEEDENYKSQKLFDGKDIVKADSIKSIQKQIKNDLLFLLKQQPQKFLSYNMVDNFNCTNKKNGIHRDPFQCDKYYVCYAKIESDITVSNLSQIVSTSKVEMKSYSCPPNTKFNMHGCFCDETLKNTKCDFILDTYCKAIN